MAGTKPGHDEENTYALLLSNSGFRIFPGNRVAPAALI
jgi:hypothetical protein